MRTRLLIFGWLVAALALWLLAPWADSWSSFTAAGAERLVLFALTEGGHASFKVGRDDEGVRLLAYLETERPEILDEAETYLYGLGLDLVGEQTTAYREHWTRSRLTVLEDGSFAIDPPDPTRIITDSRIIDLIPGPHMDEGGELVVRPKGLREGERLLVRVFRENRDAGAGVTSALSRTALERIGRLYPLPWPTLTEQELRWHTGLKRTTIPAHELVGETVAVHRYEPLSFVPTSVTGGYRMEPGEATAVNIRGPSTLEVFSATDDQLEELGNELMEPSTMPVFKVVDASFATIEGGSVSPSKIVVPDGAIWSIHWMNGWESEPITLAYTLTPDQGKSWGEPPGAGGGEPQEPERRRITNYRAGPGLGPVDVPAVAAREWGHLRVEARPLSDAVWKASPATDPGQPPVTIRWEALDIDGQVLDTGTFQSRWQYAPYERYVEAELERVSEKTTRYVYHRREAVTLRFTTDQLVDLRFLYPLDVVPLRAPEYGLPADFTGRYAPWELANYQVVAPRNHDDLVLDERLMRFDATVRIERRPERDGEDGYRQTWAVHPWNVDAQHPVVERVTPTRGWQRWYRTELVGLTGLVVGDDGLSVDYRVGAGVLGEEITLSCGDESLGAFPIDSTTGSFTWPAPEGEASCALTGPDGLWLARAEGDGPTWARRTLWRADSTTLRVSAWLTDPTEVLFIRAYTPSGKPPTLIVKIDGGQVVRRATSSEHFTPVQRKFIPLETRGAGQLVNGGALQGWQGMRLFLGSDLSRGMHDVQIQAFGQGGEAVYIRIDGSWQQARDGSVRHWTEEQL
ncbi:MAG: hypothetical protein GY884_15810 [Proteobacteria bacterium]|nr:hypothetical protein [Pseudomonadota bacterium]